MSAGNINTILSFWRTSLATHGEEPPFLNTNHMYKIINSTPLGDLAWESFSLQYSGPQPPGDNIPLWMNVMHNVWFQNPHALVHNMLSNPEFDSGFHYAPFQKHNVHGVHHFSDFMSTNWAWNQAVSSCYRLILFYLNCCSFL